MSPGVQIIYLPAYSPHLNPIELAFSVIKAFLKDVGLEMEEEINPYWTLHAVCDLITPDMASNMFCHCGYV